MPRPSIHKTLEAKLQASHEKNRRHYAKNRDRILSRQRELRVEKDTGPSDLQKAVARALHGYDSEDELDMSGNSDVVEENDVDITPYVILSDLLGCLLAMKRIKDDMVSLINEPCAFTEAVLLQFVRSITYTDDRADNGDQAIVTNMVAKVRALLNQAIPIQDEIHEDCGSLAAEYHAANVVCRYLNTTLGYLEDIEYYFDAEGISEICVAHSMGELMYQKAIHI
ncbi:hypothetical protein EV424DRAFT_1349350 [Suillus variegatus]|nr:hypothetical protein EV424DRAFT_1349350 [Suillus variegatus]